jgi:hypothetical protein
MVPAIVPTVLQYSYVDEKLASGKTLFLPVEANRFRLKNLLSHQLYRQ